MCNSSEELVNNVLKEMCNITNTNYERKAVEMFKNIAAAEMLQGKINMAQYFLCPTLLVLGIFGNLCTVLTVSHPQFYQMTSRFTLYALAASDSLLLLTNPFNQQFMQTFWNRDVRALSNGGCKLFFMMYRTGKMSSSWFIVLIAVERFIAILFPLKAKRYLTKGLVCLAISFVYIFMFSITGVWTFSSKIVDGRCMADAATIETISLHKSFVIVGAVFYSIAPITILLTVTPLIIVKLCLSQRRRQWLQHSNVARCARETSRVTLMLIGIVITYVICVTPITLVLILTFWTNEPFFSSQKPQYIILTGVAILFEQVNHSSNFFVYILCCRQFRQRFFRMVGCMRRRNRRRLLHERGSFGAINDQNVHGACLEDDSVFISDSRSSQSRFRPFTRNKDTNSEIKLTSCF